MGLPGMPSSCSQAALALDGDGPPGFSLPSAENLLGKDVDSQPTSPLLPGLPSPPCPASLPTQ